MNKYMIRLEKQTDRLNQISNFRFSHMEFAYFYIEMPVKSAFDSRDKTVTVNRANRKLSIVTILIFEWFFSHFQSQSRDHRHIIDGSRN